MVFTSEGKILWETAKWKSSAKLENDLWNKMKRREARQIWKEERKQSNREKDFGRLRSFNENEREVKKQVNEKEG